MKNLLFCALFLAACLSVLGQPSYVRNSLDTNAVPFHISFFSSTNTWSGATNVVDVSIYRQSYQTVTPIQFSGFINSSSLLAAEAIVSVYNNSSSNITATYGQGVTDRDFNSQVTLTNGNKGIFWIQVDPSLKKGTNIVFNQF